VHANRNGDFMTRRPISLTLTAWVFIVVGAGGILKDVLPLLGPGRAAALAALRFEGPAGLALIWFIRSLAVVGGIAVLWRRTWGTVAASGLDGVPRGGQPVPLDSRSGGPRRDLRRARVRPVPATRRRVFRPDRGDSR
jgi:hypothetical protein